MSKYPSNEYLNNSRLLNLQIQLAERADELLCDLEVSYCRCGRSLVGPCPVHDGDNRTAFVVYPEGHSYPGFWQCRTRQCHKTFKSSLVGLVRGVKKWNFYKAVDWCCDWLCIKLTDIKSDEQALNKARFISTAHMVSGSSPDSIRISRDAIRNRILQPSQYYLGRFSEEVLREFDVVDCLDRAKPFYMRAVVPVYDESGKWAVGFTARSLYPKCPTCELYHEGGCPSENKRSYHVKWRHTSGFHAEYHLYNMWGAAKSIKEKGEVFLVEGPTDVWRLKEAGIDNVVALFGCSLTDRQQILLETCGASKVTVMLDGDSGGESGWQSIHDQLCRLFRLRKISLPAGKDPSDLTSGELRDYCSIR